MDPRSASEFLVGVAAWENPWPFEDVVPSVPPHAEAPASGGVAMIETEETGTARWTIACALDDLSVGSGTAVLLGGRQVAVFRTGPDEVRALQNICPHKAAAVMHQGIVGEKNGEPAVFCPLHKRAYSLETGFCLDEDRGRLKVFEARVRDGVVEVR